MFSIKIDEGVFLRDLEVSVISLVGQLFPDFRRDHIGGRGGAESLDQPVGLLPLVDPQNCDAVVLEPGEGGGIPVDVQDTIQEGHAGGKIVPALELGRIQMEGVIGTAVLIVDCPELAVYGTLRHLADIGRCICGRSQKTVDVNAETLSEFDKESCLGNSLSGAVIAERSLGDPDLVGEFPLGDPVVFDKRFEIGSDDSTQFLICLGGHGHNRSRH